MQSEEKKQPTAEEFSAATRVDTETTVLELVKRLEAHWGGKVHACLTVIVLERGDDPTPPAEAFINANTFNNHLAGLVQCAESLMEEALRMGYQPSIVKLMGLGEEAADAGPKH